MIKKSFIRALLVAVIFIIIHIFYNIEIIRENIEDAGFDISNKFVINNIEESTNSSNLILFGFDDNYMKKENLFDEYNKPNYGYLFPRDKIADFINNLDNFTKEINIENRPKLLFIDYDFSYSSMPNGKELSKEDKNFLEVLKKDRNYIILIPKINQSNIVENSNDPIIKQKIKDQKIILVSVNFLYSKDNITRRYESYNYMKDQNGNENFYPNVSIVSWYLANNKKLNEINIKNEFKQDDVISNRIFIKKYKSSINIDNCSIDQSLWKEFTKYSANCSFYDIPEESFSNSLITLGGTYSSNTDSFDVLNVNNFLESIKGAELHANTLMSIFYYNGQLISLDLKLSLIIVFFTFFLVNLSIDYIFNKLEHKKNNKFILFIINLKYTIFILFILVASFSISTFLLLYYKLWFSWFIILLIEFINSFIVIKFIDYIFSLANKRKDL